MKIEVNITQDHIKHGIRGSACHCPIAKALRSHGAVSLVEVGISSLSVQFFDSANGDWFGDIPPDVQYRIDRFDYTGLMLPFTFTLDLKPLT